MSRFGKKSTHGVIFENLDFGSRHLRPQMTIDLIEDHAVSVDALDQLTAVFASSPIQNLGDYALRALDRTMDLRVLIDEDENLAAGFMFGRKLEEALFMVGVWVASESRGHSIGGTALQAYLREMSEERLIRATDRIIPPTVADTPVRFDNYPHPYDQIVRNLDESKGVPLGLLLTGAGLIMGGPVLLRDVRPLLASAQHRYAINLADGASLVTTHSREEPAVVDEPSDEL